MAISFTQWQEKQGGVKPVQNTSPVSFSDWQAKQPQAPPEVPKFDSLGRPITNPIEYQKRQELDKKLAQDFTQLPSNIYEQAKGGIEKMKESIVAPEAHKRVSEAVQKGDVLPVLRAVGEAGLGTASGVVQTVFSPLTGTIQTGAKMIDDATGNKISGSILNVAKNHPEIIEPISNFVKKHPQATTDIADLVNVLGAKFAVKPSISAVEGALGTVKDVTPVIKETIKTGFEKSKGLVTTNIDNNIDKAFPILKKDVRNLTQKREDVKTAFNDILANKEKTGIVDEQGNIKSPTKYTFEDTANAQKTRMKQVYSDYTNKLSTVDKSKFENGIYEKIFNKIDDINTKLTKENSIEGRKVLNNLKKELSSLRDLSPEGIQNYIETLGKQSRTSGGQAPNLNQIERANMGGEIRKILDDSIEKLDGQGYQDLRNIYKSHKTIESQLLQSAKSELNKTPGWTDRLANLGMTAEGINF